MIGWNEVFGPVNSNRAALGGRAAPFGWVITNRVNDPGGQNSNSDYVRSRSQLNDEKSVLGFLTEADMRLASVGNSRGAVAWAAAGCGAGAVSACSIMSKLSNGV